MSRSSYSGASSSDSTSPAAAATPVLGPRSMHGVDRTDTGAGGDLAVTGVRQVVRFTGWREAVTWTEESREEQ